MAISQRRISYAIGTAAWGSKAAQEGLPVVGHFEPEPVFDGTSMPEASGAYRMPRGADMQIGPAYYICDVTIRWSKAHAILFLDKFFGLTSIGASPSYDRTYQAEHIRGEAESPYLCLWKKVGTDHNLCLYNGIVTGVTISIAAGAFVMLTARCAFGGRSMDEADPGNWAIDWTHGSTTAARLFDCLFYLASPGGAPAAYKLTHLEATLSAEITPHFWGAQGVDRFSRGRVALSGSFKLRDIDTQIKTLNGWLESSAAKTITAIIGTNAALSMNMKIHSGGGLEDESTRRGEYQFTGINEVSATYPTGYQLFVRPARAYTP